MICKYRIVLYYARFKELLPAWLETESFSVQTNNWFKCVAKGLASHGSRQLIWVELFSFILNQNTVWLFIHTISFWWWCGWKLCETCNSQNNFELAEKLYFCDNIKVSYFVKIAVSYTHLDVYKRQTQCLQQIKWYYLNLLNKKLIIINT